MHELIVTVTSLIARIHESAFKGLGILLSCPIPNWKQGSSSHTIETLT